MRCAILTVLVLIALGYAPAAQAHKPSDSYLTLEPHGDDAVGGYWDIALRDLDAEIALDADGDGSLTWAELTAREPALIAHAARHLTLSRGNAPCTLTLEDGALTLVSHSDGRYARLPIHASCRGTEALTVRYGLFFTRDAQHRGIVRRAGSDAPPCVLSTSTRACSLSDVAPPAFSALVASGVEHIVTGYDHVLFLLALLLPLLRPRKEERALRETLTEVAKLVTAFTLAHSLTLGLAAMGVVKMSAAVIEPAIAASVALAALDGIRPVLGGARWTMAFALGLLHGFGFASALGDLGLCGAALVRALLGFNLGVELGQLALVLVFLPIGLLAASRRVARAVFVHGGAAGIAVLSLVWLVQRVRGE